MTVASVELINASNFTSGNRTTWLNLLTAQGITEFTFRINSYSDGGDGVLSSTWENAAKNMVTAALAAGIGVNIDLHTWNKTSDETANPCTWSGRYADYGASVTSFCDDATNHETIRATYIDYVEDALTKLDVEGVTRFQILNEPQATTASTSENNFILSLIAAAKAVTDKPVSVRFMCGYSPSTGHYSSSIDTAADYLCRNSYWDARYPTTSVYGTTEAKLLAAITAAHNQSKEIHITEFGKAKTVTETQRAYVAANIVWMNNNLVDRAYCFAAQPSVAGETYNIFSGFTPYPAFYELVTPTDPVTLYASTVCGKALGSIGKIDGVAIANIRRYNRRLIRA